MEYVRLGKTNLLVSRIGFGTSLLKDFADSNDVSTIVHTAYDGGINFFNSTRNKNISEKLLGDALHDLRQDIIISSTTSAKTKEELNSDVHESLMNMHVDQIDLYQYEINSFVPLKDGIDGIYNELLKMKDSGKINHIGAMTEDFDLAKKIINTNLYETLQFPFSMISSLECPNLLHSAKSMTWGSLRCNLCAVAYSLTFRSLLVFCINTKMLFRSGAYKLPKS